MIQEYYEIESLSNLLDISRRAVQKWIDSDKIANEYLKKEPF